MSATETIEPLLELEALLERERLALIEGRLDQIGELGAEKERLNDACEAYGTSELPAERLTHIRELADRNTVLLQASARGLEAVLTRLRAARRVAEHLDTYTRDGRRTDLQTPAATVSRRA